VRYEDGIAILLLTMTGLAIVVTLSVAIFIIVKRQHPIVKGSSLAFCLLVLFGILLGLCATFVLIGRPTSGRCTLYFWINAMSFGIIMTNLLTKLYRLWRIFSILDGETDDYEKTRNLTNRRLIALAFVYLALEALIIGCVSGISPPETKVTQVENDFYGKRRLACSDALELQISILIVNCAYLIAGVLI
jgi:hypothetical protein